MTDHSDAPLDDDFDDFDDVDDDLEGGMADGDGDVGDDDGAFAGHDDDVDPREVVEVAAERLVAGGACLSRRADGRIVLVEGLLPAERAVVVVETHRGADRGRPLEILEASPARVEPRCAHIIEGCGGCDLAEMEATVQVDAKVEMVRDSLRRLGRWRDAEIVAGPELDPWAFRTSMRFAVVGGRAGLRRAESHDVVEIDHCEIAHPLLDEIVRDGSFDGVAEATIRVGAATGERLVLCEPTVGHVSVPDDVRVVGADELKAGRRAWFHDEVVGRRWRISAESFFQTRPDGAAALVDVVTSMVGDVLGAADGVLLDAYCGVGLFAGALLEGRGGWSGIAAERSRSSVADARVNLADLDVRVVGTSIERLRAPKVDVVIADPSRAGLGRRAVAVLANTQPERLVLVSCDPAAAGRDTALLTSAGYRPVTSVVVDLFPHTHHVEVVTRFDRVAGTR